MNLPSFENFTIRALDSPPCPSATKISPFGAVATSDGMLKASGPSPATPGLPSVNRTLPSWLNLTTTWPFPSLPCPSVTHTLPSRSTWMPCGSTNMPAPKLFRKLAGRIELDDGRYVRAQASNTSAALEYPDVPIAIDIDRARRPPLPAVGELRPAVFFVRVLLGVGSGTDGQRERCKVVECRSIKGRHRCPLCPVGPRSGPSRCVGRAPRSGRYCALLHRADRFAYPLPHRLRALLRRHQGRQRRLRHELAQRVRGRSGVRSVVA